MNYQLTAYLSYAVQFKFSVLIDVLPLNLNSIYAASIILRVAEVILVFVFPLLGECKWKGHPVTYHKRHRGGVEV